jgi:acetolactate synthase small subunit
LNEAFNQRQEPSQIAELKQTTAAIDQKIADSSLKQQIQQLQANLSSLNEAFNQRQEPSQIAELKQTTAAIDQKIADSSLKQQIQQLQGELSSLKQAFNQRMEPGQIESVKQFAAVVQQQIADKEPVPPAFDPTPLERQIQALNKAIAQIDSTQTNFTIELAKLPQLWENIAQIQQQQSELQKLIVQIKQPPPSPVFPLVTFGGKIQPQRTKNKRIEAIMAMAEAHGIGTEFQMVTQAAEKHHLTLNPWPTNLVFGPADNLIATKSSNRSQCLFTMSGQPTQEGKVRLWLSSQTFADFYPVMEMTVTSILGFDGWVEMTKGEIEQFVASLNRLFESLEANPAELN